MSQFQYIGGKTGEFQVHALEKNNVPILLSISTLRALGAVIDFDTGQAIFKKVDSDRVIQLERSSSGHLMLDLTRDLLSKSRLQEGMSQNLRTLASKQ